MQIDAHQHFWNPARGDYGWMPPHDPVLSRPYAPSDLAPELAAQGIGRTVLVQAAPSIEETEYLLSIADVTPWVAGVVGWVDFEQPSHRAQMERLARRPKFLGVRPMIQDIPDDGWMLRGDVQWGFEAVEALGLSFDALGFPRHLAHFALLLARYPKMRVVVDHCMKPDVAGYPAGFSHWAEGMAQLAAMGAYCKLSGLITEAGAAWTVEDLRPFTNHILRVFGAERVMWGSDWPVCRLRGEYGVWRQAAETLVADLPEASRARVFGGTAAAFYRLAV